MSAKSPASVPPAPPAPAVAPLDTALALIDRWNAIFGQPIVVSFDDDDVDDEWITWDDIFPLLTHATIDAIAERMSPALRERFLEVGREEAWFSDPSIQEGIESRMDDEALAVVAAWVHRQPYPWRPLAPLPRARKSLELGFFEMLGRVLPHLAKRPIDDVLAELPPIWQSVFLPSLGNALLRHHALEAVEATCLAHGQSPVPWRKIARWWVERITFSPSRSRSASRPSA